LRSGSIVELTRPTLRGGQLVVKRAMDIGGSDRRSRAAQPLLLLVAALVKLDRPGPVLFWQERVGRVGRPVPDHQVPHDGAGAERGVTNCSNASIYAIHGCSARARSAGDALGRWLRRSSLDELPRL